MGEELKVIIKAEVSKFKSGIKDAKDAISTFKNEASKAKEDFKKVWNNVGESAEKASKVIIGGVTAVGTALVGTSALTSEYRENMAKLTTAFESAGSSANIAKKTYNDLYRVLGEDDVAVEASNHLAQMTTNQKNLSEWTNICKGVYATFGDSLPIEGLTEASNETAKVGQVTGPLADAINWAKVSNEEFGKTLADNNKAFEAYNKAIKEGENREDAFNASLSACSTEAEREKLLRETLNSVYDKASTTYEKNNSGLIAQREAQAKLQETLAKVGEVMQPVITAFTNFATQALAVVTPYIKELADKVVPQLQEALGKLQENLAPTMDYIVNNMPLIATIAGTILGIAVAYKTLSTAIEIATTIKTAYSAITTVVTAIQNANVVSTVLATAKQGLYTTATIASTVATSAFGAVMALVTSPITLVIVAIGALIAIIVLCIKNWDKIKATVTNVAKIVKEKVVAMVNAVKEKFNAMKSAIGTVIDNIKSTVSSKFNAVKGIVSNIFNNIKNTISKVMDGAKNTVKNVIDKIKGFFNFKWSLPKLKMPKISISGKFSINPPSVPKFSISWHKLGGVFDNPTLFNYGNSLHGLGEDGAEAIVPLEKNTQWLDKIAEKLSEKQGNTPIILQVDGKTFAQISVDSINSLTKQTGKLPLKLA